MPLSATAKRCQLPSGVAEDSNARRLGAPVVNGVRHEILEELHELNIDHTYGREWVAAHLGTAFRDRRLQIPQRGAQRCPAVHQSRSVEIVADHRVFEQIAQECLHSSGATHDPADEFLGPRIELALVLSREQLGVNGDHSERLLQVMASHIGKLLKVLIGAAERFLDCVLSADIRVGTKPAGEYARTIANRHDTREERA